jgi:hypothetical protein
VAGWGRVTVVHDRRANGDEETFIERDINTKDVIMATVAGLAQIGSILAVALPLIL